MQLKPVNVDGFVSVVDFDDVVVEVVYVVVIDDVV
jgi:hypothetical protein